MNSLPETCALNLSSCLWSEINNIQPAITAPVHEQVRNNSEPCNASLKKIHKEDASKCKYMYADNQSRQRYNNKLINNAINRSISDVQRIPLGITHLQHKSKNKMHSTIARSPYTATQDITCMRYLCRTYSR